MTRPIPADAPQPSALPEPKAQRRTRAYFWLGLVLGFLLLTLGSVWGAAVLLGLDDLSLSDLQNQGPVWTPPPLPTPTPTGQAAPVTSGEPGSFAPGQQARNATNSLVNIRREPGYLGKPAGDILAQMQPGEQVTILGGPESRDGLLWWRVRYQGSQASSPVEGWVAESTASGVQILAPTE